MRILALDLSVNCTGWAYSDSESGLKSSGIQSFKGRQGDSPGVRWIVFKVWLHRQVDSAESIDLFVYEQAHHQGRAATHCAYALISCVEEVAAKRGIEVTSRHSGTIKSHALKGRKGKRNKFAMVRAAAERWPDMKILDDNHADALWLLDLVRSELE